MDMDSLDSDFENTSFAFASPIQARCVKHTGMEWAEQTNVPTNASDAEWPTLTAPMEKW